MNNFVCNHIDFHIFSKLYCTVVWSSMKIGRSKYEVLINYYK